MKVVEGHIPNSPDSTKGNTEGEEGASGTQSQMPESDNADGRKRWDWKTRYPREVWVQVRIESLYLFALFVVCLISLVATWLGLVSSWFRLWGAQSMALDRYLYFFGGGLLGGVLFGMKWLYHSVARGLWHEDRRPWRYLVPVLSSGFALVTAFLFDSGLSRTPAPENTATYVAVGFLVGYFSDRAVAALSRVANAIFGPPGKND